MPTNKNRGPKVKSWLHNFPHVANKITWNGEFYISSGPLFQVPCDTCGKSTGLRTNGEINRNKKLGQRHLCSNECRKSDKHIKECKGCGSKFRSYDKSKPGSATFCSKKCYTKWQKSDANKGSNNPSWDPASDEWLTRTKRPVYKDWRSSVFIRDSYTCRSCDQIGGQLHAHHIKAFWAHPELELVLDNGVTLCRECHWKIHRGARRKEYPIVSQEATYAHS